MEIKKFTNDSFGELTTIKSPKTGIVMFMASEVGRMWGHSNIKQSVNRLLNDNEYKVLSKSKYPDFFKMLVSNSMLPSKAQRIQLVTESGLYKLALSSNLDRAKPFRDWVTSEVLPSIRKNGYYSIADQSEKIMIHTHKSIQLDNSKKINTKNYIESGVEGIIDYNKQNCLKHTGKTPKEIKEIGKSIGLLSKDRSSAKEVLRHTKPELACSMSFVDDLVSKGFDFNTSSDLAIRCAIPLFMGMIDMGIMPKELEK